MEKVLNLLVIEDNQDDFELLKLVIKREGYNIVAKRIETREELEQCLELSWDAIISDNNLPAFDATSALKMLRSKSMDIPFIIVSGDISVNTAVDAMKSGANDYIMKDELSKLAPAMERELKKVEMKREKEKVEKELEESQKRYELLAKNIQDLIYLVNLEGECLWVSPSCKKMLGFTQAEVKKIGITGLLDTNEKNRIEKEVFDTLRSGKAELSKRFTAKYKNNYGGVLHLETIVKPIYINGLLQRFVCTSRDVTELVEYRENLEFKVMERTRELNQALRKEKELVAMKSKFVSMASHEFRTPLSTISFASDYIKKYYKKIDFNTVESKLKKIEDQVKHMVELLDDVLMIGKSEIEQIKLNPTPINLNEFIENLIEEVEQSTGETHQINLKMEGSYQRVPLDKKLLRNILVNLLTNAIKYSPNQHIVNMSVKRLGKLIIFTIKDCGIGMSDKDLEKIFDPFYRNNNASSIQGTGLGLSIVKRAVELHNGIIEVKSELLKGTTCTVKIPVEVRKELLML